MKTVQNENVAQFPDTLEAKMRRTDMALAELAVDLSGYLSYAYQRNEGLSPDQLKTIDFMGWPDSRIDSVEAIYQAEIKK